jgi:hypothetical protein
MYSEAFTNACMNGLGVEVSIMLANPEIDPNGSEGIALIRAVERGHPKVVKMLLADPRIDPNVRAGEHLLRRRGLDS